MKRMFTIGAMEVRFTIGAMEGASYGQAPQWPGSLGQAAGNVEFMDLTIEQPVDRAYPGIGFKRWAGPSA